MAAIHMGFHIVKRDNLPLWKRCCLYLAAVFAALTIGAVMLLALDVNPFEYFFQMITLGTVNNPIAYNMYKNYIDQFIPLVITSIALSLAFKMRFWNIGGEGQFIMGAVAAAVVALKLGPVVPMWLTLIVMCLAAMLAAGLYGLIAAILKVRFGTNETLLTLMLNYIALYFLTYLGETKTSWNFLLQENSSRPIFKNFLNLAQFPYIKIGQNFELNICIILTFLIGIFIYIYLKRTKHGYEISVVGDSIGTAKYAGMKVNKVILRTVFLSAALIGLAAAFKIGSKTSGALSVSITDEVGWTGIIVAWLAQLSTPMIFVISALICLLQYGSVVANAQFAQIDSSFANMLQGLILFLVLAADFYTRFRLVRNKKGENANG